MKWSEYLEQFDAILNKTLTTAPYNDPQYYEYTRLNQTRMKRWLKTSVLDGALLQLLRNIAEKQHWILITEPWCGDAAHLAPFIYLMSAENPLIDLEIQLRDSGSEIDSYLTGNGKAIPKLIVRNAAGQDVFVWGPRPQAAQDFFLALKSGTKTMEEQKAELQQWYNQDKGQHIQEEFRAWLQKAAAVLDSAPSHTPKPLDAPIG